MHEAGLAAEIAATAVEQGLTGRRLRLLVSGGHHGRPEDFDSALLAHIAGAGVPLNLEIVHVPVRMICSVCGNTFEAPADDVACPICDGPPLPATAGWVELEVVAGEPS
jgi:hypothetical protein